MNLHSFSQTLIVLFAALSAAACGSLYYQTSADGPQATLTITNNSSIPAGGGVFIDDPDCIRGMKPFGYSGIPVGHSTVLQIDAELTFTFLVQRAEGVVDVGGTRTDLMICNATTTFFPIKGNRYEATFQDTPTGGCQVTIYELSDSEKKAVQFVSKAWGQVPGKAGFCAKKIGTS